MDLKVLIAVPHRGELDYDMARSLISLLLVFNKYKVPDYEKQEVHLFGVQGSCISKSRWMAVKEAKKIGATHLLFIDSDQSFPHMMLHQLLSWKKDVVAANVAVKKIPSGPTARTKSEKWPDGELVYTDEGMEGLQEVWRVGTGIMLLSQHAYRALKGSSFDVRFNDDHEEHVGEDWRMCSDLEAAGIPIYIDHGLSWRVGHVGKFEYTHAVVGTVVTR
jgi:hypothetical protein